MTNQEILAMVDHTLLKADAKKEDIKKICEEALENNTASICINPGFIEYAVGILGDKIPVCTVIGFPLGANTKEVKGFEALDAVNKGAEEIDMVINIGALKDKKYDYVYEEIKYIKECCKTVEVSLRQLNTECTIKSVICFGLRLLYPKKQIYMDQSINCICLTKNCYSKN